MDSSYTFYVLFYTQTLGVDYIQSKDKFTKKCYYIACVELLTSQIFGDTYICMFKMLLAVF